MFERHQREGTAKALLSQEENGKRAEAKRNWKAVAGRTAEDQTRTRNRVEIGMAAKASRLSSKGENPGNVIQEVCNSKRDV